MSNPFSELSQLLRGQATIIHTLEEILHVMATQPSALQFSDLQASINQLVNDTTALNNSIAAQIKEVQGIVTDFAAQTQAGNAPTQAQFQAAIAQLAAIHATVQQNNAAVQASAAAVSQVDPNASAQASSAQSSSTSASGNAGSSSQVGGSLEPGTGDVNQTPAGGATVGENTSSGVGSQPNKTLG
jgi:ATP/maltotriose-dependent transcriptional regulator MalT